MVPPCASSGLFQTPHTLHRHGMRSCQPSQKWQCCLQPLGHSLVCGVQHCYFAASPWCTCMIVREVPGILASSPSFHFSHHHLLVCSASSSSCPCMAAGGRSRSQQRSCFFLKHSFLAIISFNVAVAGQCQD